MEIQTESEDWDMSRGMITSIDTVTQVCIKFRKKKKVNKNMGISKEHNREHYTNNTYEHGDNAALATQLERQVEKRTYTYNIDS